LGYSADKQTNRQTNNVEALPLPACGGRNKGIELTTGDVAVYIRRNFVVSAGTINTFKNSLDKFWSDQDILYDYKADLHGIGNRSVVY